MQPLVEKRRPLVFGNANAAELAQLALPVRFFVTEWAHLDAFGWRDPRIPSRGYLVTELEGGRSASCSGRPTAPARTIARRSATSATRISPATRWSCSRRGARARRANAATASAPTSAADLACQETVRLGRPAAPSEVLPSVHELERIEGLARRTRAFVADVLGVG